MEIFVKKRNGRLQEFQVDKINACVQRACENIEDVSASEIVLDAQLQLFDKITTTQIDTALILSAREKIEKEPNYSFAGARLLLNTIYKEVFKESSKEAAKESCMGPPPFENISKKALYSKGFFAKITNKSINGFTLKKK